MRAVCLAAAFAAGSATLMSWESLDTDKYPNARCNDGTTAGYYWRAAQPGALPVWLIYLEGGGWCYDQSTCAGRSVDLTSSKDYPPTEKYYGIFNSTDPRFRDANLVYVKYCTSDAHVGAATGPVFSSAPYFVGGMHGNAVVNAVWDTMVTAKGLGSAPGTQALFTGASAGARGALFNCDAVGARVRAALAQSGRLGNLAQYSCFFDSAMWLDTQPYVASMPSAANITARAYALINASAVVPSNSPQCAAAYSGVDAWKCLFGSYAVPYVQTPRLFHNTYLYDSYQLGIMDGITAPPWAGAVTTYTEAFRAKMAATLTAEVPADTDHGVVAGACYSHTNTGSSKFSWQVVDGTSLEAALLGWFFKDGKASRIYIDPNPGPNNSYCNTPPLKSSGN